MKLSINGKIVEILSAPVPINYVTIEQMDDALDKKADAIFQTEGPSSEVTIDTASIGSRLEVISNITLVQEGSGAPSLSNIRNISGWDSISLLYNDAATVQLLPETVYGGSYDWVNGELTITHKFFALAVEDMNRPESVADQSPGWSDVNGLDECFFNINKTIDDAVSNIGNMVEVNTTGVLNRIILHHAYYNLTQSEWKAQYPDVICQFVFPLLESRTIHLTPREFLVLSGVNTLSSDCGDTTVTFRVDLEKYISDNYLQKSGGTVTGSLNVPTPTEDSQVANKQYVDDQCKEVFSTEETVIGTWIDGQPLYRQTFKFTFPNSYSEDQEIVLASRPNNVNVVNIYGMYQYNENQTQPLNAHSNVLDSFIFYRRGDIIAFLSGAYFQGRMAWVTIEYVKNNSALNSAILPESNLEDISSNGSTATF